MNTRIARKILRNPVPSEKLRSRLRQLYPPYINQAGHTAYPSWHRYHRFAQAWAVVHRKINKYGTDFKQL